MLKVGKEKPGDNCSTAAKAFSQLPSEDLLLCFVPPLVCNEVPVFCDICKFASVYMFGQSVPKYVLVVSLWTFYLDLADIVCIHDHSFCICNRRGEGPSFLS